MLIFECPYCGVLTDETDLAAGGEAHLKRFGPGSSDDEFESYLFNRENPKGKWFNAARCTVSMEVFGTYPAQTLEPPAEIKDKISEKKPGWKWKEFS